MNKQIYENICLIDNRKHQNNMHSHNWSNITAKKLMMMEYESVLIQDHRCRLSLYDERLCFKTDSRKWIAIKWKWMNIRKMNEQKTILVCCYGSEQCVRVCVYEGKERDK